ncbi:Uncharacterised protein [Mycobacteroides abscessus subsp. abscessus]|nr:Uncharacterised protein [Mycobacteroides abscessus subsp. abscessus]
MAVQVRTENEEVPVMRYIGLVSRQFRQLLFLFWISYADDGVCLNEA